MTTVRSLLPHPITLIVGDQQVTIAPDGPAARVVRLPDVDDGTITVDGLAVPLRRTQLGTEVTDLPDPQPGVTLIVARPVAEARPGRDDLVYVDSTVRDDAGRVIGATALARPAGRPHELLAEAIHGWAVCDSILAGANGANPRIAEIRREAGLAR